jgi:hypothetical protein
MEKEAETKKIRDRYNINASVKLIKKDPDRGGVGFDKDPENPNCKKNKDTVQQLQISNSDPLSIRTTQQVVDEKGKMCREDLDLNDGLQFIDQSFSKWFVLKDVVEDKLIPSAPGIYELALSDEKETVPTIVIYLGKSGGFTKTGKPIRYTLMDRLKTYNRNGSHLKDYFDHFKMSKFKVYARWCVLEKEDPRELEGHCLRLVDYPLNTRKNGHVRCDEKWIRKYVPVPVQVAVLDDPPFIPPTAKHGNPCGLCIRLGRPCHWHRTKS